MCGMRPTMEDSFVIENNVKGITKRFIIEVFTGRTAEGPPFRSLWWSWQSWGRSLFSQKYSRGRPEALLFLVLLYFQEFCKHPLNLKDDTTTRTALEQTFSSLANGIYNVGITSGATAVVAYIRGDVLWLAHCGDARALLMEGWSCK